MLLFGFVVSKNQIDQLTISILTVTFGPGPDHIIVYIHVTDPSIDILQFIEHLQTHVFVDILMFSSRNSETIDIDIQHF